MNEAVMAKLRETLSRISPDSPDPEFRAAAGTLAAKNEVIAKYGPMFAPHSLDALTAEGFRGFLRNNTHWNSIHRQGGMMTADMGRLRDALKILVDETLPVRTRLDQLRPAGQDPMVKGLGRAVITAILHVEYPEKYGVVNSTAEASMTALGIWPDCEWGSSFGQRYETVNRLLAELAQSLRVDLWTLDSLWSCLLRGQEAPAPVPPSMAESILRLERYLHEFLLDNWERFDLGKEWALLEDEENGDVIGSRYQTGEVGEIDLLAKHKTEDRWLVIELKRDQSSDSTVGQLLRYMGWVRRRLANGQEVRGLIICSEPDLKMRYALDGLPGIECMTYQVSFGLSPVPGLE
jgi:hypothetical protein